jgi:ATP-dependent RNA helicase RhlE
VLEQLLSRNHGSFLVFARTRSRADKLARQLTDGGVKAVRIHGDRTQAQRSQALKMFQQGHCRVMVATDVAARGIHVDGIEHVVNFDLPMAPEDFIHRVGRTGRAGASGVASTFSTRSERSEIRRIERTLKTRLTQKRADRIPNPAPVAAEAVIETVESLPSAPAAKQVVRIDTIKPRTERPEPVRQPRSKPARFEHGQRPQRDDRRHSSSPKWEHITGPQAFREQESRPDEQREFRPKGPKTAFGPRTQGSFKPRSDDSRQQRDSKPYQKPAFRPKPESGPRRDSEPRGEMKPRWESKPKWDSRPKREFAPRQEQGPRWQGKPGRDERPAQRSDSPTVGNYTPKWAAKQNPERAVEAKSFDRPERKRRQDPPWVNGPGAGPAKGPRTPIWKSESQASAKPAPKKAGRKKVILKAAPRTSHGEGVFPWQGSGMTKLKRRA